MPLKKECRIPVRFRAAAAPLVLLAAALLSCAEEPPKGTIKGVVMMPVFLDPSKAAPEAHIIVYLVDFSLVRSMKPDPDFVPVKSSFFVPVQDLKKDEEIEFTFHDLAPGEYYVSVLVDTGRPHVPKGSKDFTPYPGDYGGASSGHIRLGPGETVEVLITQGVYVEVPEGYRAPLYLDE